MDAHRPSRRATVSLGLGPLPVSSPCRPNDQNSPAPTTKYDELLLEHQILGYHVSHATGTAQFRGQDGEVEQSEQEAFMREPASDGHGVPRNVAESWNQRENWQFEGPTWGRQLFEFRCYYNG